MTTITVPRDALASELTFCGSAVNKRHHIEILKGVLFSVRKANLFIRATDLELTAFASVLSVEDSATKDGDFTTELSPVLDFARRAPEETVTLDEAKGYVTLSSGGAKLKLPTLPVELFPSDPREVVADDPEIEMARLPVASLLAVVRATSSAIGEEKIRFDLTGALLTAGKGKFDSVATNGVRIAYASAPATAEDDRRAQLGKRALEGIVKIADDGEARITATENWTAVTVGERTLMSRAADVNFPAWREVIPKSYAVAIEMRAESLLGAVRRAMVAADEGSKELKLSLTKGGITLSAVHAARSADDRLAVDYSGEDFTVSVNGGHFSEALSAMGDCVCRLSFTQPKGGVLTSGMIRVEPIPDPDSDVEQLHLIVPIVR